MIVSLLLALADPGLAERAFLSRHRRAQGVRTLPALQYEILKRGPPEGTNPTRTSAVQVRYVGRHVDGTVFDSSIGKSPDGTAIFPLRGLIPGFQAALLQMRPGDRWRIVIPPELAYGRSGHRLAGHVLVFELELIDVAELPPAPLPTMDRLPGR